MREDRLLAHGQNFEDVLLWRVLRHVEAGTYLDIGAQDPVVDSVSKLFYDAGWRGVHVEPTRAYAAKLRADRPDEMVIEAALSDKPGVLTLYEVPETGLTTGLPDIAERHRSAGIASHEISVPCITLETVFQHIGDRDVHWMKIDVEGMEREVLAGWGAAAARPWVLVIESTLPNSPEPSHHQWIDLVLQRGYLEAYFDGLSRYFVAVERPDLLSAFAIPVNVFDGFNIGIEHYLCTRIREMQQRDEQIHRDEIEAAQQALLSARTEREHREKSLIAQIETERAQLKHLYEQLAGLKEAVSHVTDHLAATERAQLSALERMAPTDREIRRFMEYEERDFLVASYRALLGRHPDDSGLSFYEQKLREGVSRLDILCRLRFSSEGRAHKKKGSAVERWLRLYHWTKKLPFRH